MSAKQSEPEVARPTTPEIVEVERNADNAVLKLIVPERLWYFQGHFPGLALLPGVVQLDWAVQYSKELLLTGSLYATTIRVKFRKPIRPRHRLTLALKYSAADSEIRFDYRDSEGSCSLGRIGFAAE